jgi:hypothetical protein
MADAAIFTALLPISSAPSIRSRAANSVLTMPALRSPCSSSRSMAARDDAVSAVSLAERKQDSNRQTNMAASISQPSRIIGL